MEINLTFDAVLPLEHRPSEVIIDEHGERGKTFAGYHIPDDFWEREFYASLGTSIDEDGSDATTGFAFTVITFQSGHPGQAAPVTFSADAESFAEALSRSGEEVVKEAMREALLA